ncbi:hypothetical protein A2U01_0107770, partial [Trifolium medium]|nr:hypothetical protein [Trifolium medium]
AFPIGRELAFAGILLVPS